MNSTKSVFTKSMNAMLHYVWFSKIEFVIFEWKNHVPD